MGNRKNQEGMKKRVIAASTNGDSVKNLWYRQLPSDARSYALRAKAGFTVPF